MTAASRHDWRHVPTILIVSEEATEATRLAARLEAVGWAAIHVDRRETAVDVLDHAPVDALVTRLRAPRIAGLNLLALVRARNPEAGGILIIDPGEEESATQAMARGVIDFQTRPLNPEKLHAALSGLFERQRLTAELAELRRRIDRTFGFAGVVGESGAMHRVLSRLREIAPLEMGVLVTGEPGTGKDLIATVLHQNSPRRNGRFVRLDCRALGGRELARELFGPPTRGTRSPQRGRLEEANGGTLYLDEVGALPRDLQVRLTEALRAGQVRVDLERPPVEIDVRPVGSTSRDLEGEVERGRFHEGLFARLTVARIDLPPLRHRRRDIPRLARSFLGEGPHRRGAAVTLGRDALDCLQRYDWPGNVGELRSVVEDLAVGASPGARIGASDLPKEIRSRSGVERTAPPTGATLRDAERLQIGEAIRAAAGNRVKAARILGIGVRTLYRKLKAYAIEHGDTPDRIGKRRMNRT
jgi:DNA-binding NtrC family response regulator